MFNNIKRIVLTTLMIVLIIILLLFILNRCYYSYNPSSGIWEYKDNDLKITIYVPDDGGVPESAFLKCRVEFIYKEEERKSILAYNNKIYQLNLILIEDYDDIENDNIGFGGFIHSMYRMEKGKWIFENITIRENIFGVEFGNYEGKDLVFTKIGSS